VRTLKEIIGVSVALFIAGVIAVVTDISHFNTPLFWLGIALIAISIGLITFAIFWKRLFGNRAWRLYTSEIPEKPILYDEKTEVLRSENLQSQGMYCKLDLGRERRLDYIRFYHGNSRETPLKWQMWFYREDFGFALRYKHPFRPYIETGDIETEQGSASIIVTLSKPISARYITVMIKEPEKFHQWCIKAIRVRVLVLHSLVKHTIGMCRLDEL